MAKFCGKCGTNLNAEFGLCPNCDKEALEKAERQKNIPNFCTICGAEMDKQTGTCPNCVKNNEATEQVEITQLEETNSPTKKKSSLTTFLTVVMCFVFAITSILSVTIFSVRQATTQKGIDSILNNVSFSDLMNMVSETQPDSDDNTNDIFNSFKEHLKKEANLVITEQLLDSFVEKSTIKTFVAQKISAYANSLYAGDGSFSLTQQEVFELLKENSAVMQSELGKALPDDALKSISSWLIDDEEISEISISVLKEKNPVIYYVLHIGLSYFTLAALVIISLLMAFAMVKNNYSQTALGIGIIFTVIGSVLSIAALFATWLPSIWEIVCGNTLIGFVVGKLLYANIITYGIIFAVGVALLVIRKIVLISIIRRKAQEII